MADAVEMATAMTNSSETLIVVTADHSHSLTISGLNHRGASITGLSFDTIWTLINKNI